jgi:alkanesulfonate monooxygenase SsuD/methylene tetrahydromethanopterin reductase-like flavin-dependent oxidoreductase (luciferase family)
MMTFCIVGRDRAEVDERLRELGRPPWKPEASLIGTVDEVAERLRDYEAAGITRVMCQHLLHRDVDMVEILGRELAPAVA